MELPDAGRAYIGGNPPDTISFAGTTSPIYRKAEAPFTILGARQKQWFLDHLRQSRATWKIGAIRSARSTTGPIRKIVRKA